jgi:hypothetical protein
MFGGVADEQARFWVFDGDELHGPLTEEFLKTGMGKKVFPRDSYVCEKSTLNGWKPLMELRASIVTVEAPPAPVSVSEAPAIAEVLAVEIPVAEAAVTETAPEVTSDEPVLVNNAMLTAVEVEVEQEEPTASMDLVAMAAAAAATASGSAEPSLSLQSDEPPAPPSAPVIAMPAPPAPPMPPMPEPPAAPVIELKPMTLEAAPAFELAPPAPPAPPEAPPAPAAAAQAAPAIEIPILMPVLEAASSSRKSA